MARGKAIVDAVVSEDAQEKLNQNPYFQIAVLLFIIAVATYIQVKGVKGLKEGTITDKRGKMYTGTKARILGGIYLAVGLAVDVVAIVMLVQHLL